MRDGVSTAGRQAAANPVVTPADTPPGQVLNDSTAFRDSLRIRAYLRIADRLEAVSTRSGDVTVTARLPAVTNASDLRAAKHRVSVERAGPNETALRATVENIVLTVRRNGVVVSTRQVSPTVVVPTQALMLHDQVSTYQTRLNNGLDRPGLSRRMTARLYPMAWTRGYAQYGGAGIENVVANRHVSLATNGALLGVQRSTFGRSDPAGRRALTEATAMTGIEDLVRGSQGTAYSSAVLDQAQYKPVSETPPRLKSTASPSPVDSMTVGVNGTADTAFRSVTEPSTLNETLEDAYTVEVALEADEHRLGGGPPGKPPSPGPEWTLVAGRMPTSVETVGNASGSVATPDGWHAVETFSRTVERQYTRTAVWQNGADRRRTTASSTARYRVTVAVVGRHHGRSPAPNRTIRTAHDASASPLNGSNLADVEPKAMDTLVDHAGGRDETAERVVDDSLGRTEATVTADQPPELHDWAYRDLMGLRAAVRNTTVTVERGRVGTFETNPPRELRERVAQRRARLAAVPDTYDSTAQKARVAARLTYLNAVSAELEEQASARDGNRERIDAQLTERTEGSLRDLRKGLTARETAVPRSRPVPVSPAGPVRTRIDTQTPYLTLAELDESRYRALDGREHPLVARNTNVFTVPYGDAADAVVDGAFEGGDRVRLATAANTLAAANETLETESSSTLAAERDAPARGTGGKRGDDDPTPAVNPPADRRRSGSEQGHRNRGDIGVGDTGSQGAGADERFCPRTSRPRRREPAEPHANRTRPAPPDAALGRHASDQTDTALDERDSLGSPDRREGRAEQRAGRQRQKEGPTDREESPRDGQAPGGTTAGTAGYPLVRDGEHLVGDRRGRVRQVRRLCEPRPAERARRADHLRTRRPQRHARRGRRRND